MLHPESSCRALQRIFRVTPFSWKPTVLSSRTPFRWSLTSHHAVSQNLIFRFLQNKARIQIMLYENTDMRIEGRIIGFDEYMNLVLDDAEEISRKKESRRALGRILLKGDNITLMMSVGK